MNLPKQRRKRGVKLTLDGWKKLQIAKGEREDRENCGKRYTYEDLSELSGLSVDTLNKIFSSSNAVDRQSLICLFSTFNLSLECKDYDYPEPQIRNVEFDDVEPELSTSLRSLDSAYYEERPPLESSTYQLQSPVESTMSYQQEQKQVTSEDIASFSNLFNISNSTIKNVSGSGTINYHESPGTLQNRPLARVRGRAVKIGYSRRIEDLQTLQAPLTRGI